jgi:hypothetical protein
VQIRNNEEALILILETDAIPYASDPVAKMQTACRTVPRQDPLSRPVVQEKAPLWIFSLEKAGKMHVEAAIVYRTVPSARGRVSGRVPGGSLSGSRTAEAFSNRDLNSSS